MKSFVDLHLCVPLENMSQTQSMIHKASKLGYNLVGIPFSKKTKREKIIKIKKICNEANLDFVSRINLYPKNAGELIYNLRNYRRKFEIICVTCNTKDVARQAAKDRRVDLLQFSLTNLRRRFFDEQEAELSSKALSALEIELSPILQLKGLAKIRILSKLQRENAIAKKAKVPIILSSGASSELFMRGPYDFGALASLFDLPFSGALKALSEIPLSTVEKNRKKMSPDFVLPGIKIKGRKIPD